MRIDSILGNVTPDGTKSMAARAHLQREYEAEYRKWVATLSPAEREQLASQGFDEPDGDIQQINGKRRSVEEQDLGDKEIAPDPSEAQEANRLIALRLLMELANSGNVPLHLDVMLSALGAYDHEGETTQSLGEKHGVSKQRFDYLRNRFIDAFQLPAPNRGRDLKERTLESLRRCTKHNSPSISQRKSASYGLALPRRPKMYSLRQSKSEKS